MDKRINWKRYWAPEGKEPPLDEYGFLSDPEQKYFKYIKTDNCEAVCYSDINETQCMLLLGEPGIGKSDTIEYEYMQRKKALADKGILSLFIDMSRFSDATFESYINSMNEWTEFKKGKATLYLYLDSLDECMAQSSNIYKWLIGFFENIPTERLFLRIACRVNQSLSWFENDLKRIWSREKTKSPQEEESPHEDRDHTEERCFGKFTLAPLRSCDVEEASKVQGLNPIEVMEEIRKKDATFFATTPADLTFILNIIKNEGTLPDSHTEVYIKGLGFKCSESNERRRKGKDAWQFSPNERIATAGLIAASIVLGKKNILYIGIEDSTVPDNSISASDILGGNLKCFCEGSVPTLSKGLLDETLETSVFSSGGPDSIIFTKKTYMEFLAANYLKDSPLEQILNLFISAGPDGTKGVPTLLAETVRWIANLRTDVLEELIPICPEIIIECDQIKDTKHAKATIDTILLVTDNGIHFESWEARRFYQNLNHSEIAQQLRPVLTNKNRSNQSRYFAINLATSVSLSSLQGELVDIALDMENEYFIRHAAAAAVSELGDNSTKLRLLPLIEEDRKKGGQEDC